MSSGISDTIYKSIKDKSREGSEFTVPVPCHSDKQFLYLLLDATK
jgi:formylmethanofuran dehydrogenase subunit E-like metal-binding protein